MPVETVGPFYAATRNPYNYAKVEQVTRDVATQWLTLDEITTQLNMYDDESQDEYLQMLELAARMAIEDYLGTAIFATTWRVYYGNIGGYNGQVFLDLPEVGPGAAVFPDSDYESLATQLGYQASYVMQMGSGVLVPQVRAAWEHEFEADQGNFAGIPVGQLDEDLAVLGAGVGYYMNCGWNVVLDYEARLGEESQSHYVGLKAGVEF